MEETNQEGKSPESLRLTLGCIMSGTVQDKYIVSFRSSAECVDFAIFEGVKIGSKLLFSDAREEEGKDLPLIEFCEHAVPSVICNARPNGCADLDVESHGCLGAVSIFELHTVVQLAMTFAHREMRNFGVKPAWVPLPSRMLSNALEGVKLALKLERDQSPVCLACVAGEAHGLDPNMSHAN